MILSIYSFTPYFGNFVIFTSVPFTLIYIKIIHIENFSIKFNHSIQSNNQLIQNGFKLREEMGIDGEIGIIG